MTTGAAETGRRVGAPWSCCIDWIGEKIVIEGDDVVAVVIVGALPIEPAETLGHPVKIPPRGQRRAIRAEYRWIVRTTGAGMAIQTDGAGIIFLQQPLVSGGGAVNGMTTVALGNATGMETVSKTWFNTDCKQENCEQYGGYKLQSTAKCSHIHRSKYPQNVMVPMDLARIKNCDYMFSKVIHRNGK